jgi:hypothetical protein
VVTFWAVPLTLMVAPPVRLGMRKRIDHEPLTQPVTVSVVVSLTGYDVLWVTVIPQGHPTHSERRIALSGWSWRNALWCERLPSAVDAAYPGQ